MKLLREILTEASKANPEASRIITNALKAVDRHTNTDMFKPYYKHVRITHPHGHENLVNVFFKVEPLPSGIRTKGGVLERDFEKQIQQATLVAKELEDELKGTVSLEDSEISDSGRGVTLFVVSDDFAA